MTKKKLGRLSLVILFIILLIIFYNFEVEKYLSLSNLKAEQINLANFYAQKPFQVISLYVLIYILSTAISLPGATILTLAGGAIFGFGLGVILVSIASTIGATLAFLSSRFLFYEFIQNKFRTKLKSINEGIEKEGAFYLFTLRVAPIFPFFLVNLTMGISKIKTLTFVWVSQIGMLFATAVYVNAGTQLAQLNSPNEILSLKLLLSFCLIGFLPLFSKAIINFLKSRKYLRAYKKPKAYDYNIVVIGGGSAGLVSSYIAAAVKAKVVLIEKEKMGGDCLNTGCVPSKAFIKSAQILNYIKNAEAFGLEAMPVKFDFAKVMDRVHAKIKEIAPHDSIERYTGLGVECIQGDAKIISPYEVEVNGRMLTTKNIIVATGAQPLIPSIEGLNEISYLTSNNVWNLRHLPKRIIVLGGGAIGCELAQCFARFGSKVVLVEMSSRIMSREDEDVSTFLSEKFYREGIDVLTNHKALRIKKEKKELVCDFQGKEVTIEFDEILIALGRKANVEGFGLEDLKVEVSSNGTVAANDYLQTTNYPNIYVCGDVTGPFQFTHTASHQAWYASVNALFGPFKKFKVDYSVIPWCTYTDPEVARVGLNELEAKKQNIDYQISCYEINELDRAIVENSAEGFIKVLTVPHSDKILGVTIVGSRAGDIICEYVAAMKHGFGLNKILNTIHIYPTFAEANKFVAGVWKKQNAPIFILKLLKRFHEWRR